MASKTERTKTTDPRTYFGLHATPFSRELPIAERWRTPVFDEPLAELQSVVEQRMSGALIAPAGSGKTVVLRALVDQLPEARFRVNYIKVTSLGKRDICREIAAAVGLPPAGSYPALVRRLQERFETALGDDGRRSVLLIDEAHEMSPSVLAMFRILTNFDMDSRLVVSLVLCGQSRLRALLAREEATALAQRLALVATLRPLSRAEVRHYVSHRLTIAGGKSEPFDDGALDAIYEVSRGNLRAIDHVAFKALQMATTRGVEVVDAALIGESRKRLVA